MLSRRPFLVIFAGALLALAAPPSKIVRADSKKVHLAVVVAKDSPVSDLSFATLKRLYLGENVNAPGGKRLIPLNHAALSQDRIGFDRAVLGMSAEAVARYWIDRKIRGQSGPPKAVQPTDVLQRVVSHLDGAISYVRHEEVRPELKIVRIDGKAPGDPNYAIQY
ncbi:MAG: hypothetical protein DIU78_000555 [Pseudomonadota bacterium]|nr:MAG: hypothetical protein DIU78_18995 [Pseudomonadota bacterium]